MKGIIMDEQTDDDEELIQEMKQQTKHLRSISVAVNVMGVLMLLLFILGACSIVSSLKF
jgi:hypothetical protein